MMNATPHTLTKLGAPLKRDVIRAYKERHGFTTTWDPTLSIWSAFDGHGAKAAGLSEVQALRELAKQVGVGCEL